jgi:hypothetical protein
MIGSRVTRPEQQFTSRDIERIAKLSVEPSANCALVFSFQVLPIERLEYFEERIEGVRFLLYTIE